MCSEMVTRQAAGGPEPATLAAFLVLVVIAGGNAPAIREVSCSMCELDPFWGAATRFLLAGVLFAFVACGLRAQIPRGRALVGAALYGVLQFGAGFGLVYWGLVRAPAGLGQILLACVPLFTFALAVAHRQERFRWEGIVGALLALAGVGVVFGSGVEAGVPLSSMLALVAGALCWAEALIVVKGFPPVHPAAMNAVAMAAGALLLLALGAALGEEFAIPEAASTWGAQTYLVIAGSIGVFWLYLFVLGRWTASAASYQLVLIPLVTLAISAWLQDEQITPAFVAGSLLVLVGVYVGALRRPARRPEAATQQQART
jgi:drug/metabolite transporter (DMT)-like permease